MFRAFQRPFHVSAPLLGRTPGPIEASITQNLSKSFEPIHLQVINQSPHHHVPEGSESHFKVVIIADRFQGLRPVQKHRLVHDALKEELKTVHALSIVAQSPDAFDGDIGQDPACMGGKKAEDKQE